MKDGAEIEAALFYDSSLGEATLEVTVREANAEDILATSLGDALRNALDACGAVPLGELPIEARG
jgi:hypothetical protein